MSSSVTQDPQSHLLRLLRGWIRGRWRGFLVTLPFISREAQGRQRLLLSTMHEEYEFVSPSSVAIAELVALFLEGLKERSVFAMALQDRKATGARLGGVGAGPRVGSVGTPHAHLHTQQPQGKQREGGPQSSVEAALDQALPSLSHCFLFYKMRG